MAKKAGVRRWRHWHYADDFDQPMIFTKRLEAELFLVLANKAEAGIIFRDEWEQDVRAHPNFHCYHVVEQPPAGWAERSWRITADILRRHLPSPGPETVLFLCGPTPMMNALEEIIRWLGYLEESVILP